MIKCLYEGLQGGPVSGTTMCWHSGTTPGGGTRIAVCHLPTPQAIAGLFTWVWVCGIKLLGTIWKDLWKN